MTRLARAVAAATAGAAVFAASGTGATRPAPAVERRAVMVVSLDLTARGALRGLDVVASHEHVGIAVVRVTAGEVATLRRRPGVRAVVPDRAVRPVNDGGGSGEGVLATDRLGPLAGRRGTGEGVTVAVVDTGVADTPALDRASGRLVDGLDVSGDPARGDGYGHGTFLANLIAGGPVPATGARALGVAPGARVVDVRVADSTGTTSLRRLVAGLDWVVARRADHGIRVASLAFATEPPTGEYVRDPLTDAVERVRDAGIAIVVAAGNRPGRLGDPGFSPRVISVGAADLSGGRAVVAPFSGSGTVAGLTRPDVHASGVAVLSLLPPASTLARTYPGARRPSGLWRGSGTSQATAVVAGVVAGVVGRRPGVTVDQLQFGLRSLAGTAGPVLADDAVWSVDWSANSWSANSWSANSWSANSWSANSWSANSWSANSWSANSWSAAAWGD